MFKNLKLWANIMLGMGFAIVFAVAAQGIGTAFNLRQVIGAAESTGLRQTWSGISAMLVAELRTAEALSALVANLPEVQARFAEGDRDGLRDLLLPSFKVLERDYGVVQFQFHEPPARSFLRLHMLEKYGDDLSAIRHSVVESNATERPRRGLEVGVAGLGARGMVPMFHAGRHTGVVEFGMSFGPEFFTRAKDIFGVESGLHMFADGQWRTFASTYGEPLLAAPQLAAALAGTPQQAVVRRDGTPMAVYAAAITDYSGKAIGVMEVAQPRVAYAAALSQANLQAWIVGALAMLVSLAIAQVISRSLARRIGALRDGVQRVAAGDLGTRIPSAGRDEIAELGRAADALRAHLHDLVARINANAEGVHRSAMDIAGAVENQAANSTEMSASVAEITSTMEQLSASAVQIAEYAETVVAVARGTFDDSRAGAESMQRLLSRMQGIRDDSASEIAEIVNLGGKSKEISRIMDIIDTVADQTKLIAFNAALEAASAGEAGKRFGVVAAEIRRLADSVTESTAEIGVKVAEIQESISRLVVTSEKSSAGIEQGMRDSAQTAALLTTLVGKAGETTTAAQQINLSSQQQRTASSQVVMALREIVAASADTAESVTRIADIAQAMTERAGELQSRVDGFGAEPPAVATD